MARTWGSTTRKVPNGSGLPDWELDLETGLVRGCGKGKIQDIQEITLYRLDQDMDDRMAVYNGTAARINVMFDGRRSTAHVNDDCALLFLTGAYWNGSMVSERYATLQEALDAGARVMLALSENEYGGPQQVTEFGRAEPMVSAMDHAKKAVHDSKYTPAMWSKSQMDKLMMDYELAQMRLKDTGLKQGLFEEAIRHAE